MNTIFDIIKYPIRADIICMGKNGILQDRQMVMDELRRIEEECDRLEVAAEPLFHHRWRDRLGWMFFGSLKGRLKLLKWNFIRPFGRHIA